MYTTVQMFRVVIKNRNRNVNMWKMTIIIEMVAL